MKTGKTFRGTEQTGEKERQREKDKGEREATLAEGGKWLGLILTVG